MNEKQSNNKQQTTTPPTFTIKEVSTTLQHRITKPHRLADVLTKLDYDRSSARLQV